MKRRKGKGRVSEWVRKRPCLYISNTSLAFEMAMGLEGSYFQTNAIPCRAESIRARGEHKNSGALFHHHLYSFYFVSFYIHIGFPFFTHSTHTQCETLFLFYSLFLDTMLLSVVRVQVCVCVCVFRSFIYFAVFIWSQSIFIHLRCNGVYMYVLYCILSSCGCVTQTLLSRFSIFFLFLFFSHFLHFLLFLFLNVFLFHRRNDTKSQSGNVVSSLR